MLNAIHVAVKNELEKYNLDEMSEQTKEALIFNVFVLLRAHYDVTVLHGERFSFGQYNIGIA